MYLKNNQLQKKQKGEDDTNDIGLISIFTLCFLSGNIHTCFYPDYDVDFLKQ